MESFFNNLLTIEQSLFTWLTMITNMILGSPLLIGVIGFAVLKMIMSFFDRLKKVFR